MDFDKLIQVLVFGCGYRRIADRTCSATTLRRRREEWIALGLAEQLRLAVLAAYDRMLGLSLDHLAVDGCTTNAPCGGQSAGPSPVDRRKQGLKRSVAVEAGGIPLAAVPAPANHRDDRLLAATLDAMPLPERLTVYLDAGYDYQRRGGRLSGPVDVHALRWHLFRWTSGSSSGAVLGSATWRLRAATRHRRRGSPS